MCVCESVCVCKRLITTEVINPRPAEVTVLALSLTLGRRVTVVVLSFIHSFIRSVNRATESSTHFFAPVKVRTG